MYNLGHFKYVNHLGEFIESDGIKLFIQDNDLLDWTWKYDSALNQVRNFSRDPVEKSVPIVINADNDADGLALRDRLFEIAEKDVLANEPGRLYFHDWYMMGYVIASAKSNYMLKDSIMQNSLTFVSETGMWYREKTVSLPPETESLNVHVYRDPIVTTYPGTDPKPLDPSFLYPDFSYDYSHPPKTKTIYPMYDFAYDYMRQIGHKSIVANGFKASDFVLTIWGYVDHPIVRIGGHAYGVDATVFEGERLVIDSRAKTIRKIGRLGEVTNLFNARDKEQSVFEPIPPGSNPITWPGTYGVDLTVYEERSEPAWTG